MFSALVLTFTCYLEKFTKDHINSLNWLILILVVFFTKFTNLLLFSKH